MADTTQTRTIKIVVDTSGAAGLKSIADQMSKMNKNTKDSADTLNFFKSAFIGAFAALRIQELVSMSDSMQLLFDRIASLSGGTENAKRIFGQLIIAANQTKTSVEALANTYSRVAVSTKELKLSSEQTIAFTQLLHQTYRLSGTSAEEASNSVLQLTQAMALGVLRGQDFKSVLSQNAEFGNLLTKGLKVTRGELQKMAENGELTTQKWLPALWKQMGDVNARAATLSTTFSQSLNVSMNNFKLSILELNKEFDASGKFATSIEWLVANWKSVTSVLVALIAVPVVPWILGIKVAMAALAPEVAAVSLAVGLLTAAFLNWEKIKDTEKSLFIYKEGEAAGSRLAVVNAIGNVTKLIGLEKQYADVTRDVTQALKDRISASDNYFVSKRQAEITDLKRKDDLELSAARRNSTLELNLPKGQEDLDAKRKTLIKDLNKLYDSGGISASGYYAKLEELDGKIARNNFRTGKEDLEKYNNQLEKLSKSDINRQLKEGTISLNQFNDAIEANKIQSLNSDLDAGKISLLEYDAALVKVSQRLEAGSAIRSGADNYIKSIGTLAQQTSNIITQAFSHLEDAFVQMTKTGKVNFSDFAQAVLDDLNRIIIRSTIIAPLAKGILNYAAAGSGDTYSATPTTTAQASGAAPFAAGGVFDAPASFSYGGGKMGLLGEAGPEAIVPLSRNSAGELGIKSSTSPVIVNITNNSGGEIEQTETTGPGGEKMLDIIIHGKVREGIASGKYDRSFQGSFGLNRRGS